MLTRVDCTVSQNKLTPLLQGIMTSQLLLTMYITMVIFGHMSKFFSVGSVNNIQCSTQQHNGECWCDTCKEEKIITFLRMMLSFNDLNSNAEENHSSEP